MRRIVILFQNQILRNNKLYKLYKLYVVDYCFEIRMCLRFVRNMNNNSREREGQEKERKSFY